MKRVLFDHCVPKPLARHVPGFEIRTCFQEHWDALRNGELLVVAEAAGFEIEILVPLLFNDGRAVPESLLVRTFEELRDKFGAASWETQTVRGAWESQGTVYEDNLTGLWVDVPDRGEDREFFVDFKERLKARFAQLEIWMTSHPLDRI